MQKQNGHHQGNFDSFGKERAQTYDQSNRHLELINSNLHYLIEILLNGLPQDSRILCLGVGTGSEIIALAKAFPSFTFVGVDPSESMLQVCRDRFHSLGLNHRCQLVHGFVQNIHLDEQFDAALCLLVLHHTSESERKSIVVEISKRLKPKAYFITSELSVDFADKTSKELMENWKSLSRKAGTPEEKIQLLPEMMKQHLSIVPPSEVENLLERNGFETAIQFFQSFLIRAWYARKS